MLQLSSKFPYKPYLAERVELLYSNIYGSIFGLIPYLTVLGIIYYQSATIVEIVIWSTLVALATLAEWSLLHHVLRHGFGRRRPLFWANLLTLFSGFTGLFTSLGAVFLVDPHETTLALVAAAFLFTPVFGSAIIGGFYLPTHIVWSSAQIVPFSIWLMLSGDANLFLFGLVGMTSALPISIFWAIGMQNTTVKTISLRDENKLLFEQMRAAKGHAEEANLMKSKFIAAASHDLRQPIHAMGLFFEALNNTNDLKERALLTDKIKQALDLLRQSFDEILDISKLDSGVIAPNMECVNFSVIQQSLLLEYQASAKAAGVELRSHFRDIHVYSDIILLTRVLRNLLENALRHSTSNKILFGMRKKTEHLDIYIIDKGKGMSRQVLNRAADAFYKVDSSVKGSGLGLTIVYRLCELLNHPIQLTSHTNQGTTARVSVPLCQTNDMEQTVTQTPAWSLEQKTCLVIDDDEQILDGMNRLLTNLGCKVQKAIDWPQVEKIIDTPIDFDFIICDVRLGNNIWGPDLVNRIYERRNTTIPCLLVTGETEPTILAQLRESGFMITTKPISPAKLRTAINRLLNST